MSAQRFGEWVVRWRWPILLVTPLLVVAMASGGRFLTFSTDYRIFFSKDNPQLLAFEKLQDTYVKNDNLLIALEPKDGNVFTPETLAAIGELTEAAWQVPHSIRVDSLTNYQHTFAEEDDLIVEDLIGDPDAMTPEELAERRAIALAEPLLVNRVISPKGDVTAVNVTIQLPGKDPTKEVPEVVSYVRPLADQFRADHPDINVYLSGIVMMNNAFPEASQGDGKTLMPIMFGVIIVLMLVLLRSVTGTVGTVLIMVFSAASAMGLFGWMGGSLSGPVMSAPVIIITLAVANSIHILITMIIEMRAGKTRHAAIIESMRVNFQPVFLTAVTTAIGFLSMNASDVPPFHHLGNIVAAGVMLALIYSVFFLPAFVAVLPVKVRPRTERHGIFIDRFADLVVNRRGPLFWAMLALVGAMGLGMTNIEFNDQFSKYFDERYTFRTDTDFVKERLTGIDMIEFSVDAGQEGGIAEPEYLHFIDAFADWFRAQPETIHVNVLSDTMKRLNRSMHGDDAAFYTIPDSRELAAQYLLLYEMSLPYGLDLNNQVNVTKSATRFTATLHDLTTKQVVALEDRTNAWLATHLPAGMEAAPASTTLMFAHIAFRNINSMLGGTTIALILISGILIVAVRSVKIGLVSLIPNLVPAMMAFGLWGLAVGKVGLATSVVAAMSLGIVVDDTVHFLTKYLRARREHGYDAQQAVRYSFHVVGTALAVTSIILIGGFLVLSTSGFQLNVQMGLLTAICLAFALVADFLLLPTLLMRIDKGEHGRSVVPPSNSK